MITLSSNVWKYASIGCGITAALFTLFAMVGTRYGYYYYYWGQYTGYLTRKLRRLHIWTPGSRIAGIQMVTILTIVTLASYQLLDFWYALFAVVAIVPAIWLEMQIRKRIKRLDFQADVFCTALANALKSTPSVGVAIENASNMLDGPVHQEFQFVVKETRLGKSLDEALQGVGPRAQSPKLSTVLSAILIGRQVGGNLPKVLETTAMTLREMDRLEGVVRQKTAESKMQMWAMTFAPFIICGAMQRLDSHFFDPLTDGSFIANLVCFVAAMFYVCSLIAARKILKVDI